MSDAQLSPDGYWWWTGAEWVAAADHPEGRAALAARSVVSAAPPSVVATVPEPAFFATVGASAPGAAAVSSLPAYGWAPPGPRPTALPAGATPPFDTLGLISILCNLFPVFGIGQIAAVLVSMKADRERARLGYPRSTLSVIGRVLGYVFGALFGLAILVAILLPLFLPHHPHANGAHRWTKADNDAVVSTTRSAVLAELTYARGHGTFADLPQLTATGFAPTQGVSVEVLKADRRRYCLQLTLRDKVGWYDSTTDRLSDVVRCA